MSEAELLNTYKTAWKTHYRFYRKNEGMKMAYAAINARRHTDRMKLELKIKLGYYAK